jgi:carboxyl-terminal processing protease
MNNNHHTGRTILFVLIALILLAGAFSGGFVTGWVLPKSNPFESITQTTPNTDSSVPQVEATPTTSSSLDTLFAPFWESWKIIHDQYVDQPVDDLKLMQGAIRGMFNALGDEHSSYMDPEEYKQATMPLDGSYTGIGAWVDASGDYLTVTSPMPDSPAEKAGLKPGDQIVAINGVDQTGIDPSIVLQSVLGPEGEPVTLTIRRGDPPEEFDVEIVRARITVPSIESKMLDSNIAYIALYTFGENTATDTENALKELLAQNPVGLILDLRNNSGGYLDTAIEIVSQFIPDGIVMQEQLGSGEIIPYEAIPGGLATKIPMVVLVNEGSASASEITAGAIQDRGRGLLIGTTTYGKGSVQNWIPLDNDQGAVRVTIARWLTPNGRQINKLGLTPDIVVELTEEDYNAGLDPQLDRAVQELLADNQ